MESDGFIGKALQSQLIVCEIFTRMLQKSVLLTKTTVSVTTSLAVPRKDLTSARVPLSHWSAFSPSSVCVPS